MMSRFLLFLICFLSFGLSACGGSGTSSKPSSTPTPTTPTIPITSTLINPGQAKEGQVNVIRIYLDAGPASISPSNFVNVLYADVKICNSTSTLCTIVDHLVVDTGSVGLRIMASAIPTPLLNELPTISTSAGGSMAQCLSFAQGVTWGSVRPVNLHWGGLNHSGMVTPVRAQIISDNTTQFRNVPSSCSNQGSLQSNVSSFGANGLLGIGLFQQDCGPACSQSVPPLPVYFSCTTQSCDPINVPLYQQISHPVASISGYSNGVSLILPTVSSFGQSTANGLMVLGVDTAPNNISPSNTRAIYTDAQGYFTTSLTQNNQTTSLSESFIDSGSSIYLFPPQEAFNQPSCPSPYLSFYCPSNSVSWSLSNRDYYYFNQPIDVHFSHAIDLLNSSTVYYAYSNLAGQSSALLQSFDYGLPFFFGRRVGVLIEGSTASSMRYPGMAFFYTP